MKRILLAMSIVGTFMALQVAPALAASGVVWGN